MTMGNGATPSDGPIEDLAFLARSEHRIRLLTQLSGEPRTRRDLHDVTGISQPTLGRILADFEERRWVVNNHDGSYTLSPLGEQLAGRVEDVLAALETMERCAGFVDHLPVDQLGFDSAALLEARITAPTRDEPLAHMRRFDELADEASTVKLFGNVLSCSPAADSTDADRAHLEPVDELVVTGDALETDLEDRELRAWVSERVEDGDLTLFRYDDSAAFLLGVFDHHVAIVPVDDGGMPRGLIEADGGPIREWVTGAYEERRESAMLVRPEAVLEQ